MTRILSRLLRSAGAIAPLLILLMTLAAPLDAFARSRRAARGAAPAYNERAHRGSKARQTKPRRAAPSVLSLRATKAEKLRLAQLLSGTPELAELLTDRRRNRLTYAVEHSPAYAASLALSSLDMALANAAALCPDCTPSRADAVGRATVIGQVLAGLAPTESAVAVMAAWECPDDVSLCEDDMRAKLAASTLVNEALANAGVATFDDYVAQHHDSAAEVVHLAAWTTLAEDAFRGTLALGLDGELTAEAVAYAIAEAIASGDVPAELQALAGAAESVTSFAPSPCAGETAGLTGSPYGKCSLPGQSSGPGDPSPMDHFFSGFDGPGGQPIHPDELGPAPAWLMPGACYGVNPKYLFNGAGGDPENGGDGEGGDTGGGDGGGDSGGGESGGDVGDDDTGDGKDNSKDDDENGGSGEGGDTGGSGNGNSGTDEAAQSQKSAVNAQKFIVGAGFVILAWHMGKAGLSATPAGLAANLTGLVLTIYWDELGGTPGKYEDAPQPILGDMYKPSPLADADLIDKCTASLAGALMGCMFGGEEGGEFAGASMVCTHDLAPVDLSGPGSLGSCACLSGDKLCAHFTGGGICKSTEGAGGKKCPAECKAAQLGGLIGQTDLPPDAIEKDCSVCKPKVKDEKNLELFCASEGYGMDSGMCGYYDPAPGGW